jgi:amphi-Trp domain-containing protein
MARKAQRDVEKVYGTAQFVAKLRRLADALEKGKPFSIQVAGEPIRVPDSAEFNVEHERAGDAEEVEFQLKWTHAAETKDQKVIARRGTTRIAASPRARRSQAS